MKRRKFVKKNFQKKRLIRKRKLINLDYDDNNNNNMIDLIQLPSKKKRKLNFENIPKKIKTLFGYKYEKYLCNILDFIRNCKIGFVYNNNRRLNISFKELCIYDYEIDSMKNFIKGKKFITSKDYVTFLRSVNFEDVDDLTNAVIDLGLGNISQQDIAKNELLKEFTPTSSQAFVDSLAFIAKVKLTMKERLLAILEFNSHLTSFLSSENGWNLSNQIFQEIEKCKLYEHPKGITTMLDSVIKHLESKRIYYSTKDLPVHRLMCGLLHLCSILKKCFCFATWNYIKNHTSKRLIECIKIRNLTFRKKLRFVKQLRLTAIDYGLSQKDGIHRFRIPIDLLIKLFNRWSYVKFRLTNCPISSTYIFDEFSKSLRSLSFGVGNESLNSCKLDTIADVPSSSTRKKIREKMFFLKPIAAKGRSFIFVENGTDNKLNSEGYYTLE